ncbi:MAG: radical SAM protein [Elusimicrobiota bacterium]
MKAIELLWLLQARCNYECPYCDYNDDRGGGRQALIKMDKSYPVAAWAAAWRRFFEKNGRASVYISGSGEPTLYHDFTGLLKEITRYHYVIFDTNLYWSVAALSRFVAEIPPQHVRVETSFHPHTAKIEEFAAKAEILRDHGFIYNCRMVAHPELFGRIDEFRAYFESQGLRFVLTPFTGTHAGRVYPRDYTPEERAKIMNVAHLRSGDVQRSKEPELIQHLVDQHIDSPEGRLCSSGLLYGCIMPDGTVYRCQDYGMRGWDPLGNFLDEEFRLAPAPSLCRSKECGIAYRYLVDQAERFGHAPIEGTSNAETTDAGQSSAKR